MIDWLIHLLIDWLIDWYSLFLTSGGPESMRVSPEDEQIIENGNVVVYTVDIIDKSGNPTTESRASVTCKVREWRK